jgi:hypothetical protein
LQRTIDVAQVLGRFLQAAATAAGAQALGNPAESPASLLDATTSYIYIKL